LKHQIQVSDQLQYAQGLPLEQLALWQPQALDALLLVDFELEACWMPGALRQSLTAVYLRQAGQLWVSATDRELLDPGGLAPEALYKLWARRHGFGRFTPGQALRLSPTYIPKPWGREIWYTGVEQRGVCGFSDNETETPIPWLQAVMPDSAAGSAGESLILLKILDPSPEPVRGDLYFELHQEKREVYVVTHVDERAWPDGVGAIRYGFDSACRAQFSSDREFKAAYVKAVRDYEECRRRIDALPANAPVAPALHEAEAQRRKAMDRFTHLRPLRVGDVVKVPLLLPHSLQHGVRTVEFQTPVYERKILSFAQRVLTQDHWDTDQAAQIMHLEPPAEEAFELLHDEGGAKIERIVDFDDFEVRRVYLQSGAELQHNAVADYAVAMIVAGRLRLGGEDYQPGSALLLPQRHDSYRLRCEGPETLVLLLALPR